VDVAGIVWFGSGVVLFFVLAIGGLAAIRSITMTPPEPPPAGELRKVNVRYRCSVCGMEIRTMLAPDEDPPPPKHCLEDMEIIAPLYE
jgi:hypothetical protein